MTQPDRDPVAALEAAERWMVDNDSCELPGWHDTLWVVQDALLIARAQAALVAVVERYVDGAGYDVDENGLARALAGYRRALEAKRWVGHIVTGTMGLAGLAHHQSGFRRARSVAGRSSES